MDVSSMLGLWTSSNSGLMATTLLVASLMRASRNDTRLLCVLEGSCKACPRSNEELRSIVEAPRDISEMSRTANVSPSCRH